MPAPGPLDREQTCRRTARRTHHGLRSVARGVEEDADLGSRQRDGQEFTAANKVLAYAVISTHHDLAGRMKTRMGCWTTPLGPGHRAGRSLLHLPGDNHQRNCFALVSLLVPIPARHEDVASHPRGHLGQTRLGGDVSTVTRGTHFRGARILAQGTNRHLPRAGLAGRLHVNDDLVASHEPWLERWIKPG